MHIVLGDRVALMGISERLGGRILLLSPIFERTLSLVQGTESIGY